MYGCCHVWHWLMGFRGVVLSCLTLSCLTIFTEVSPTKPEDSLKPLYKAVLHSVTLVRKLVNGNKLNTVRCEVW